MTRRLTTRGNGSERCPVCGALWNLETFGDEDNSKKAYERKVPKLTLTIHSNQNQLLLLDVEELGNHKRILVQEIG
ncbi:hypothetical protein Ocin01_19306 [Orchesella cincta]|uniref:Uncharacterized protein n=1 Tax=Orchesella cincta TaxID=48709 RepID=A0A1D2M341_ORCCI|nr:hypothetical protein Ocin01_19306 [Orchesella cincta]